MIRRGFSLIEILVATVLAAILMTGVLYMLAGVARDRRAVGIINTAAIAPGIVELVTWDLGNARSWAVSADGKSTVLVGVGGIDPATLSPDGRLVRVTYRLLGDDRGRNLWRYQEYLDQPGRSGQFRELVAADTTDFSVEPAPPADGVVPSRVRLRIATGRQSVDRTLWIK